VLVSLAAIPVVLSVTPSPELPVKVEIDLPRLFRISRSGTIGCLGTGFSNGAFWSLAPVFIAAISDDITLAAWFMTSTVVGGALAQWPLGYLSDRIGRRKIIAATALAGAAVSVFIVMTVDDMSFVGINLLGAAWGAAAFPLYAIAVAHANDYAEPDEYVMVSGGLLLMYGIGAILGPFAASAVMTFSSKAGLYLFTGLVQLLLVLYITQRIFRRSSAPAEQHIAFSDALATAHTASQVYDEEIQHQADD
jgi:MFS family permease